MTLRKLAIVKSVRENAAVTHFDATRYVEFVLEKVKKTLANGEDVLIHHTNRTYVKELCILL